MFAAITHDERTRPPRVDLSMAVIALLVWENPYAKAGGLFPVASRLAGTLGKLFNEVVLLSPLHQWLTTAPASDELERVATNQPIGVRFGGADVAVELFRPRNRDSHPQPWILMKADGHFIADGGTDPYSYRTSVPGWDDPLLRDALFACAAAPHVLAALGKRSNVVFSAHDWHFAMVAHTVPRAVAAGVLDSACVALTLHNVFDRSLPNSAVEALLGN